MVEKEREEGEVDETAFSSAIETHMAPESLEMTHLQTPVSAHQSHASHFPRVLDCAVHSLIKVTLKLLTAGKEGKKGTGMLPVGVIGIDVILSAAVMLKVGSVMGGIPVGIPTLGMGASMSYNSVPLVVRNVTMI